MAKMWNFYDETDNPNAEIVGWNDPSMEHFRGSPLLSLAREIIQNSMDAKREVSDGPVQVVFNQYEVKSFNVPGYKELLDEYIPACLKRWEGDEYTTEQLDKYYQYLRNHETLPVLQISDFQTTGLTEKGMDVLLRGTGYSEKSSNQAAGSKGIGKAAPFVVSNMRMVLYRSISDKEKTKYIQGVVRLTSFDKVVDNQKYSFAPKGFTDRVKIELNQENLKIQTEIEKGFKNIRIEPGTDVLVVGFDNDEVDWEIKMLVSILENFLIAIYKNLLEVIIERDNQSFWSVNSANLEAIITTVQEYFKDKGTSNTYKKSIYKVKCNYEVLTSKETLRYNIPVELVQKYEWLKNETDVELLLLDFNNQLESGTRCILETRQTGMLIKEVKNFPMGINFSGICRFVGPEVSSFLRTLENSSHTQWEPDRAPSDKKDLAKEFLKDVKYWERNQVKNAFLEPKTDSYVVDGIEGLDNTVLLDSNTNDTSLEMQERAFSDIIVTSDMKKHRKKSEKISAVTLAGEDEGEKYAGEVVNVEDGNTSAQGSVKKGESGKGDGNPESAPGGDIGGTAENPESSRTVIKRVRRNVPLTQFIQGKIFLRDAKNKIYVLKGEVTENMVGGLICLKAVTENGSLSDVEVKKADSHLANVRVTNGSILLENFSKGQRVDIEFELTTNGLYGLQGDLHI